MIVSTKTFWNETNELGTGADAILYHNIHYNNSGRAEGTLACTQVTT